MTTDKMIPVGFQYYRAPTPARREWRGDLAKIAADGFNTVKFWVQWRWNNPEPDRFDFSDIDELMELAAQFGLKVVLNLILDAAPAWVYRRWPDCLMETEDGRILHPTATPCRQGGGAPGPCFHHAAANEAKYRFTEEAVRRYAGHPALYCWDVWNEPELTVNLCRKVRLKNLVCYCENCVADFRIWLENRYGSIAALNDRWGRNYVSFSEVEPPRSTGTCTDMVDWRRYFCDTVTEDLKRRVALAKRWDCATPVMCHTVPMPLFNAVTCGSDDFSIAAECDIVGNSVGSNPFASDLLVSAAAGKTTINSEIHAAYGSTYTAFHIPTRQDMLRHVFIPFSKGTRGFLLWQYRPETLGSESPAWGSVTLEGEDTPWHGYFREINACLQTHAEEICSLSRPAPEVGLMTDVDNEIFVWQASGSLELYQRSVLGAYGALHDANYDVRILSAKDLIERRAEGLSAIYFPCLPYVSAPLAGAIERYVRGGGTAIFEPLAGMVSVETGRHAPAVPGCGLERVSGARAISVFSTEQLENSYDGRLHSVSGGVGFTVGEETYRGAKYRVEYRPVGAEAIGSFSEQPERGAPIVRHRYGKGCAYTFGTLLACGHKEGNGKLPRLLREMIGIRENDFRKQLPFGLRCDILKNKECGYLVYCNGGETELKFTLPAQFNAEPLLDSCRRVPEGYRLSPGDVAVFRYHTKG